MPSILVAVSADVLPQEGYEWHAVPHTYLRALARAAGVTPVIVPALAEEFDVGDILDRVDGVLATGAASNVHPARYGVAPAPAFEPYDTARDALTDGLIRGALARGLPLLAVCRGLQEMNVACGGSLHTEIQEMAGRADHRAPVHPEQAVRYAIRQDVEVKPDGVLAPIVGAGHVAVNSLHRQAIDRLGDGLSVEATAPDGTIEAISARARGFALGVQWHPEYFADTDETSRAIFRAFGAACRAYRAARA